MASPYHDAVLVQASERPEINPEPCASSRIGWSVSNSSPAKRLRARLSRKSKRPAFIATSRNLSQRWITQNNYCSRVARLVFASSYARAVNPASHTTSTLTIRWRCTVWSMLEFQTASAVSQKFTFFYLRTFTIGGRSVSLYSFENDVIRPLGEERLHFALNCMVVSCSMLPRTAFMANQLDRQLRVAVHEFVNEPRNVRVDAAEDTVWLSAIFQLYAK